MFIVILRFSDNKANAGRFMDGHKAWLNEGFDDGVFLLAGSLPAGLGGGILVAAPSRDDVQNRVDADPFVAENVVTAEIVEIEPSRAAGRLAFLLD